MEESGIIRSSITLPVGLWNKVRKVMDREGIDNFSFFVSKSLRVNMKIIEQRNVKEYLDNLNEAELAILKKEIKKRG